MALRHRSTRVDAVGVGGKRQDRQHRPLWPSPVLSFEHLQSENVVSVWLVIQYRASRWQLTPRSCGMVDCLRGERSRCSKVSRQTLVGIRL